MSSERVTALVQNTCPFCGQPSFVRVYLDEYEAWQRDKGSGGPMRHIQTAMPELPPELREILVSGAHPKCWDEAMGGDE